MSDPRPTREGFELFNAIAEQLSEELADRVENFARLRCEMLKRSGLWGDSAQLTQAAIDATIFGERSWDPDRCNLFVHLCGVVKSRTWVIMKQGERFRHEQMGGERGDETDPIDVAALLRCSSGDPETALLNADMASRTVAALMSMAE